MATGKRSEPKVYPPGYFLGGLILMGALHFGFPGAKWLFFPWNLTAFVPLLAGLRMMGSAARYFQVHEVNIKPFTRSTSLVTDGPFRTSRNPMYLGMMLMLIAVAALFGTVTPWAVIPVFYVVISKLFIEKEEEILRKRFKDEYRDYCHQVRRWV